MDADELEYVGFWPRFGASIIDGIIQMTITIPILVIYYGAAYFDSTTAFIAGPVDLIVSYIFPAVAVLLFWHYKQATPGKMAISARIVDASTGNPPTTSQFVARYFGYIISAIPLFLGFIWVAFDDRKQSWHDKLAGTVVVRKRNLGPRSVRFDRA